MIRDTTHKMGTLVELDDMWKVSIGGLKSSTYSEKKKIMMKKKKKAWVGLTKAFLTQTTITLYPNSGLMIF